MELKPGYILTEIGVIPEDWEVLTLGEHLNFKNGLNKASEYFGYGTPIINYMDVYQRKGIMDVEGRVFLSANEIRNFSAQVGDVFFTRTSETPQEIGVSSVLMKEIANCVFSGFVLRGRPKSSKISKEFFHNCFSPKYVRIQIVSKSSYTTRALTNGRSLSSVKIAIPSIPEQTAIATALSDMDALIAQTEKIIEKKKAIKQAMMQRLLSPYDQNGELKKGWAAAKLSSIGVFSKGQGIRKDQSSSGEVPCIRYGELYTRHHNIIREFYSGISEGIALGSKRISYGSILFAGSGETKEEIGKCAAFVSDCEAYAGGDIVIFEKHNQNPVFLGYVLNTPPIQRQKASRGQGDAVVHISKNQLGDIVIHLPPLSEQTDIATTISNFDGLITQAEKHLEKLQLQKQGMMQSLLTGKIRIYTPNHESATTI